MNNNDLVSEQIRQQHAADIAKSETFRTHGVSEQIAKDYLDTPEGTKYWLRVREADPSVSTAKIDERAINQLTSGRELPRMEIIDEPLAKIVPHGSKVSGYSPFFTKLSEIENTAASGQNLSDRFGLPIASEGTRYDIYTIRPKAPTEVFVNTVAPTSELGGQVTKAGGAQQYLVPNRSLYNEPELLKQIDNQLPMHLRPAIGAAVMAANSNINNALPDGHTKVRIRPGTALGIAGLALEAYDAAEVYRTSSRLRSEGNATAADSQLIHFGSRAVGGWAGFGLGFSAGAAVGVETGPGLLVTGTIGGIVGTLAGDKIAQWTDNQKIYTQNDQQKNTWTFDPENPSLSWRRKAPIDAVDDGIDHAIRSPLRASPAMANELNYLSTRTSVEFVLGSPPVPKDPFIQAANAKDTLSFTNADWKLDSNSGEWRREVALAYAERGLTPTRLEVANPERAAELNRAAAETVLQNTANTPAAIAARYELAHINNGWAAYGEVPQAVKNVRTDVNTLMASDANSYQLRASGEWVSEGRLYNSTASGNLREELNATREVLQAVLPPPQTIQAPPQMTEEARLRDTVMGAYLNAKVTPSAERVADAAVAVRATWTANGLSSFMISI